LPLFTFSGNFHACSLPELAIFFLDTWNQARRLKGYVVAIAVAFAAVAVADKV